jgi:ribosomal protein S7
MGLRFRRNIYRPNFFQYYRFNSKFYNFKLFFYQFINLFVKSFAISGKVSTVRRDLFFVFYSLFFSLGKVNPFQVYYFFFNKLRPRTFLVSYRISGTVYKIPHKITTFKSFTILFQFLRKQINFKSHRNLFNRAKNFFQFGIRSKFLDLKKRRDEIHKLAYINYTYARRLK